MTTEEIIKSGDVELFMLYHRASMNLYALTSVLSFYDNRVKGAVIDELKRNGAKQFTIECFERVLEDCKAQCHIS